jgi:hypothetical protein
MTILIAMRSPKIFIAIFIAPDCIGHAEHNRMGGEGSMHRIEVSVPRVDGSQHVFANPAARIRQGFEHVRPSKEEAALPFEQVARVQAEGWMFLLATARQLGVHSPGDRHGYFLAELTPAGVMLLRSPVAPILKPPKGLEVLPARLARHSARARAMDLS